MEIPSKFISKNIVQNTRLVQNQFPRDEVIVANYSPVSYHQNVDVTFQSIYPR